jgi:hypothetical protein
VACALIRHCGICECFIADGDKAVFVAAVVLATDGTMHYQTVDLFHQTCHQRAYPEKPIHA